MMERKQKPISVSTAYRDLLDRQKEKWERRTGEKSDWGSFLGTMALLGLAAAGIYQLVKARERTPQSVDVACSLCGADFVMAVPQGIARAVYVTCPHCHGELVVDLGASQ